MKSSRFTKDVITKARAVLFSIVVPLWHEEVKLSDLGRRSILSLRQNLIARIHEHDNTIIYKQFIELVGEIYTAEVHHVRKLRDPDVQFASQTKQVVLQAAALK